MRSCAAISYRLIGVVLCCALASACSKEPVELGAAIYPAGSPPTCVLANRSGLAGAHDGEMSLGGIRYSVRTPANYDSAISHPLLMVYPGAGQSRHASERFTGLTKAATTAGFVVAYSDHRSLSLKVLDELARIPAHIASKWCIDTERIFLTGHSDGGTAASAIAFRQDSDLSPSAIAPSAAGLGGTDLEAVTCPRPLPVMVLHNSDDQLFPGLGAQAARWWASCNQCDVANPLRATDGCIEYSRCSNQALVRYCEHAGAHQRWPDANNRIIDFFLSNSNEAEFRQN